MGNKAPSLLPLKRAAPIAPTPKSPRKSARSPDDLGCPKARKMQKAPPIKSRPDTTRVAPKIVAAGWLIMLLGGPVAPKSLISFFGCYSPVSYTHLLAHET